MRNIEIPKVRWFKEEALSALFCRVAAYCFILFAVLPILAGVFLPPYFDLSDRAYAALPQRLILLGATCGVSLLAVLLPALVVLRFRVLRNLYLFLLLPLSVLSLAGQAIMYREFGTEIDVRVLGLFQGNFPALWIFACKEYHGLWVLSGMVLASLAMTYWIGRGGRARWIPHRFFLFSTGGAFLLSGTLALALRPRIEEAAHYHPSKLSSAPLFQLASFLQNFYLGHQGSGYQRILKRVGEVAGGDREEITARLGQSPEEFTEREVRRPLWLREQPSHVFLFLMESVGYDSLVDPAMSGLTPSLLRYAEEGLSVPQFVASGFRTIDAVHSMSAGASGLPRYPVPRVLTRYELDTLPKLMERAEYEPLFLAASHRKFGSKGDVAEAYGYRAFKGCADLAEEFPRNEWGVRDEDFYRWARKELQDLSTPHFVTFLNVSNHPPFDAPVEELKKGGALSAETLSRFAGRSSKDRLKYAQHLRYADQKMGEMVEVLHKRHPKALFVFAGDHCNPKLRNGSILRVPFVLWGEQVLDGSVDCSGWFGSHMDVLATLACLVLPDGTRYRSLGEPVWNVSPARVSAAGRFVVSTQGCLIATEVAKGSAPSPHPEAGEGFAPMSALQISRKASAIEALSWGYINAEPLLSIRN